MSTVQPTSSGIVVDELDLARAQQYALLATLLAHSPDTQLLAALGRLDGDATPLGAALALLGEVAGRSDAEAANREYFELFSGLGQATLLPYASHYLTGALYGRPLGRLRETLRSLGIERTAQQTEPEDHAAVLCEVMASLIRSDIAAPAGTERQFFEKHLARWIGRFFADLENATSTPFYAGVGALGQVFIGIETEGFALPTAGRADGSGR
jgi:TorA maturation chaperone TorD